MVFPALGMATSDWEDDWELCNDDGFVYKRKKRRLDALPVAPAPPLPDPQAEEDHRRERKKRALIKIKEKYQREIDHWEHLSNTLRAMEETAHQQQRRQQHEQASLSLPLADSPSSEFVCRTLVDELLLQVVLDGVGVCFLFWVSVWLLRNGQKEMKLDCSILGLCVH